MPVGRKGVTTTTEEPEEVIGLEVPTGGANKLTPQENLGIHAGVYLFHHEQMKVHEADKAAAGAEVRTLLLADPSLLAQVGEHRETIVPMGNGITEVLVRLQKATSVKVTDDALSVLRAKLGAVVDAYTITTVSLAPGALESLYTMGYITKQDVEDLTSVTSTESLIIKDASSKPKTIRSSKTKKTL